MAPDGPATDAGGVDTGLACGDGTEEVVVAGGIECRPGASACADGLAFDEDTRACVAVDGPSSCGEGTEEIDGECVAQAQTVCGPGTEEFVTADGTFECRLGPDACGDGLAFDEASGRCVPIGGPVRCGAGTRLNEAGDACVISPDACGPGTVPDEATGQCVRGRVLTGDCADPPVLEGQVREETVLREASCHLVRGLVQVIEAELIVEPGVTLVFERDAGLDIVTGRIEAIGRADAPIRMVGLDGQAGDWTGVRLAGPAEHRLEWVEIRHAGSSPLPRQPTAAGLVIDPGVRIEALLDVTLADNGGYGLFAPDAAIGSTARCAFVGNSDGPTWLGVGTVGRFDESSRFMAEGEVDPRPIRLAGGRLTAEAIWSDLGVPMEVHEDIDVLAPLTIEGGVELVFADGVALDVLSDGVLTAEGSPDAPIRLGPLTPGVPWRGVRLATAHLHQLRGTEIAVAGGRRELQDPAAGALVVTGGAHLVMEDTIIRDSAGFGLVVTAVDDTRLVRFTANALTDNVLGPAHLHVRHLGLLDVGSTYGGAYPLDEGAPEARGDALSAIRVTGDNVDDDVTWRRLDAPFRFTGSVRANAAITVEPGVVLEFDEGAWFTVADAGSLTAEGLPASPIALRGSAAVPRYWNGVLFAGSQSPRNRLAFAVISDAGREGHLDLPPGGLTLAAPAAVGPSVLQRLEEVIVAGNDGFGLVAQDPARIGVFSANRFIENTHGPAFVGPMFASAFAAEDHPRANELIGNGDDRLWIAGGPISAPTTWRALSVPYFLVEDVRADRDATFIVEAGADVVAALDVGLEIMGSAFELGTEGGDDGRPVWFRGDRELPGGWRGISIQNAPGGANHIRNVRVEHAGGAPWADGPASVVFRSSPDLGTVVSIDGLRVRASAGPAVVVQGALDVPSCARVDLSNQPGGDALGALAPWCQPAPPAAGEACRPELIDGESGCAPGLACVVADGATVCRDVEVAGGLSPHSSPRELDIVDVPVGGRTDVEPVDAALDWYLPTRETACLGRAGCRPDDALLFKARRWAEQGDYMLQARIDEASGTHSGLTTPHIDWMTDYWHPEGICALYVAAHNVDNRSWLELAQRSDIEFEVLVLPQSLVFDAYEDDEKVAGEGADSPWQHMNRLMVSQVDRGCRRTPGQGLRPFDVVVFGGGVLDADEMVIDALGGAIERGAGAVVLHDAQNRATALAAAWHAIAPVDDIDARRGLNGGYELAMPTRVDAVGDDWPEPGDWPGLDGVPVAAWPAMGPTDCNACLDEGTRSWVEANGVPVVAGRPHPGGGGIVSLRWGADLRDNSFGFDVGGGVVPLDPTASIVRDEDDAGVRCRTIDGAPCRPAAWGHHELIYSFMLKAIAWAADRAPRIRVRVASATIDEVLIELAESDPVRQPGPRALTVHARRLDPWGYPIGEPLMLDVPAFVDGTSTVVIPVASPLAAGGRIDFRVWSCVDPDDCIPRTENWGSAMIPGAPASTLDVEQLADVGPDEARFTATLSTVHDGVVIEVVGVDDLGRVFDRTEHRAVDGPVDVVLRTTRSASPINRVVFTARADASVIARAEVPLRLPEIGMDATDGRFLIASYKWPTSQPHLTPYMGDLMRAIGFDTMYSVGFSDREYVDFARLGLFNIIGSEYMPSSKSFDLASTEHLGQVSRAETRQAWAEQTADEIALIERLGAIARAVDDEVWAAYTSNVGVDRRIVGAQVDMGDETIAEFRAWLPGRYAELAASHAADDGGGDDTLAFFRTAWGDDQLDFEAATPVIEARVWDRPTLWDVYTPANMSLLARRLDRDTCEDDASCGDDSTCTLGICRPARACEADGECAPLVPASACRDDGDCNTVGCDCDPAGQNCFPETCERCVSGRCETPYCPSGLCETPIAACAAHDADEPLTDPPPQTWCLWGCQSDLDCPLDQTCLEGECRIRCASALDCPARFDQCVEGACITYCPQQGCGGSYVCADLGEAQHVCQLTCADDAQCGVPGEWLPDGEEHFWARRCLSDSDCLRETDECAGCRDDGEACDEAHCWLACIDETCQPQGRLDVFNALHGLALDSWDQVVKPIPQWLDFREFMNDLWVRHYTYLQSLHDVLGGDFRVGPGVVVWRNREWADYGPTYRGGDYARFGSSAGPPEPNADIPVRQPLGFLSSYPDDSPSALPGAFNLQAGAQKYDERLIWRSWGPWAAVLEGADGLWHYLGNQIVGNELALRPTTVWLHEALEPIIHRGLGRLVSEAVEPQSPIRIFHSSENMAMQWLAAQRPRHDPANGLQGAHTRRNIQRLAEDVMGLRVQYIYRHQIIEDALTDGTVKLLVLPLTRNLDDVTANKVRDFVEGGGVVLADWVPGENTLVGTPRGEHLLADLFGVRVPPPPASAVVRAPDDSQRAVKVLFDAAVPDLGGRVLISRRNTWLGGLQCAVPGLEGACGDDTVIGGHIDFLPEEQAPTAEDAPVFFVKTHGEGRAILLNFMYRDFVDYDFEGDEFATHRAFADYLSGVAGLTPAATFPRGGSQLLFRPIVERQLGDITLYGSVRGRLDDAVLLDPVAFDPNGPDGDPAIDMQFDDARFTCVLHGAPEGGSLCSVTDSVEVHQPLGGAVLVSRMPYAVTGLSLALSSNPIVLAAATGRDTIPYVDVTLNRSAEPGTPTRHPIRLEVRSPTGIRHPQYSQTVLTGGDGLADDTARFALPFALNDRVGPWSLRFIDAATGIEVETRVIVTREVGLAEHLANGRAACAADFMCDDP